MITIEQLNALRDKYAPTVAMRHGHGHTVENGDGIRKNVLICGGTGCTSSNSMSVRDALEKELVAAGIADEIKVVTTGCFGLCALGPIMIVYPEGTFYSKVSPDDMKEIVTEDDELIIDDEALELGDIVISIERAKEQAKEIGNTFLEEIAFLTVHSTLHLLGYDHERSEEDEKLQCDAQKCIVATLEI